MNLRRTSELAPVSSRPAPQTKVLIAINAAWNITNFRALIRVLIAEGYEVLAMAPHAKYPTTQTVSRRTCLVRIWTVFP